MKILIFSSNRFIVMGFDEMYHFLNINKNPKIKYVTYDTERSSDIFGVLEANMKSNGVIHVFVSYALVGFYQSVYSFSRRINFHPLNTDIKLVADIFLSKIVVGEQENQKLLTERELQMLSLMKSNFSDDEISLMLEISKKTISCHRQTILKKLRIPNKNFFRIVFKNKSEVEQKTIFPNKIHTYVS